MFKSFFELGTGWKRIYMRDTIIRFNGINLSRKVMSILAYKLCFLCKFLRECSESLLSGFVMRSCIYV